ncbi:hypothetical protein Pmani_028567 [Petrolisthes manimaculis]|uniref:Dyslexia-associated protein KIAA0319-like protein n=1 Tax=Petrolisthes manimaculis TaxID=1843537 RepID=A0AAE1P1Z7_9EUCA|nr:hypothetical protein Pmani_028567 [Petrolisthes manimaculis]
MTGINTSSNAVICDVFVLLCGLLVLLCCAETTTTALPISLVEELKNRCPSLDPHIHENTILAGGRKAGTYTIIKNVTDSAACVEACCNNSNCHVALLHDKLCFSVQCKNTKSCQLTPRTGTSLVVVRNINSGGSGEEAEWVEKPKSNATHMESKIEKTDPLIQENNSPNAANRSLPYTGDMRCEYGLRECGNNEACIPLGSRRKDGLCHCVESYHRDPKTGECIQNTTTSINSSDKVSSTPSPATNGNTSMTSPVPLATSTIATPVTDLLSTQAPSVSSNKPVERLVVSINNKTVYLPAGSNYYEKSVTLSAYAIGGTSDMRYDWSVLQQPDSVDGGSITDSSSQTITLSHLSQGVYVFQVEVTADGVQGRAVANVTVKPAKRINQPPKAVISSPSHQIKLPNSGVIIDGSASTDDDGIESYHWEMVTVPLGYNPPDKSGPTLQLTDLVPGNYTIMLRVKDKEGLEGTAQSTLNVIKETDYPPTANAGGDKIIYLPQTETILYGNSSTDDHGIAEWEWTKGPKDSGKAVDMQDTRTPFLRLSNLEEGHYQFILRVTDSIGQSSNTSVYVYVQKPNLSAPKASAGDDRQLVLPNTSIVLDGTHSSDTSLSTHWLWKQYSGPNMAQFSRTDAAKVNVTGLTKGKYVFGLTVWSGEDSLKNTTDNVTVTVIQDKNVVPVASAGGDQSVTLPVSVVVVDGSGSTDDVAVSRWLWERDPASLAAGTVINGSNTSPILMFSDVVAGRYVWKLTVWDDQGASSSDTVSIIVKEGKRHLDEVEVVVGGDIGSLSYSQLTTLLQKFELFLHTAESAATTHLIALSGRPHSGRVSVTFLVYAGNEVMKGTRVVSLLRHHMLTDSSELLDLPLLSVDTIVCQNNCSGHGECVSASRECRCHTWWMESFTRRHMGDGLQNCDWSVVYVFVTLCMAVVMAGLVLWGSAHLIATKFGNSARPRRKPPRYSPLDGHDEGIKRSLLDSGSESDTEILFDTRKMKHRSDKPKNGYVKTSRIRTFAVFLYLFLASRKKKASCVPKDEQSFGIYFSYRTTTTTTTPLRHRQQQQQQPLHFATDNNNNHHSTSPQTTTTTTPLRHRQQQQQQPPLHLSIVSFGWTTVAPLTGTLACGVIFILLATTHNILVMFTVTSQGRPPFRMTHILMVRQTININFNTCSSQHLLLISSLAHLITCSSHHLLISSPAHHITCSSHHSLISSLANLNTCSSHHLLISSPAHLITC